MDQCTLLMFQTTWIQESYFGERIRIKHVITDWGYNMKIIQSSSTQNKGVVPVD